MKKMVSLLLSVLLLAGAFMLSGCSRQKNADLSDNIHLQFDAGIAAVDGTTVQSKKDHWRLVIHACTSASDLDIRRDYFKNTLKSIVNENVVAEEKTFGEFTFQTEYHESGGKFAGSYFTAFQEPVKTKSILKPIYGLYCYVSADDNSYIPEIEAVMNGISVTATP